ncbi:MAG: HdeD family acid-resistance protein [Bdellovibrionaceae bacterium]|nr:HdeD family acid-resistance protein [Pseudobdellovibrionaceae bacterium]MBX3033796.1 HdeD family acid-resistance protein [Pseudobdellovibrionaceae bacterium]
MFHSSLKIEDSRLSGGWFVALGLVSIILGILGFGSATMLSQFSTLVFGILLLIAGGFQVVSSFRFKEWTGVALNLLMAILQIVTGGLILSNPLEATLMLTLVIAMYLIVSGVFRVVWGFSPVARGNGLVIVSGMVSTFLGMMVWAQWPVSGLWFIGVAIAADLMVDGIQWLAFGFALSKRQRQQVKPA